MDRRSFLLHSGQLFVVSQLTPNLLTEMPMPETNQRRNLSFSNDWVESVLLTNAQDAPVEDAIVANVSATPLEYSAGQNRGLIPPWKSTILRQCKLDRAERAVLLHVRQRRNLGGVALGWEWYGHRNAQYPRGTPLYISSQDEIGEVEFDPFALFAGNASGATSPRKYRLKLNLWYTPEETDCGIHTGHQFLEVHTQVLGTGHMQKFQQNSAETIYEDVLMPAGYTHNPFFKLENDRRFSYPWHRYYADTDCIWMAIELHPV